MAFVYGALLFLAGTAALLATAWWWGNTQTLARRQPFTILCPENLQPAEIGVNAALAARTFLESRQELRIARCSRWPEKEHCEQACAAQIPFVADDRSTTQYAPGGLPPEFLRVLQPVRITPEFLARLAAQAPARG